MGGGASIVSLSAADLGAEVGKLGPAYESVKQEIVNSGITGNVSINTSSWVDWRVVYTTHSTNIHHHHNTRKQFNSVFPGFAMLLNFYFWLQYKRLRIRISLPLSSPSQI